MTFHPLSEPERLRLYRVNSGTDDLAGRNAGNLVGVLQYLDWCEERLMGTGDYLSVFEVIVGEGYEEYVAMAGGKPREKKKAHSRHVGRAIQHDSIWYSFPEQGSWQAFKIGSIPLSEMYAHLRRQDKPFIEMTFQEQAQYLEKLFQERFPS